MLETSETLRELLKNYQTVLRTISDQEAEKKPARDKWSPKEILGHLADSATNNQMKFVKAMECSGQKVAGYNQDKWVFIQQYQKRKWEEIIDLWVAINSQIAHIMAVARPETRHNELYVEGQGPYTLEFLMKDYINHQKHHLAQIVP